MPTYYDQIFGEPEEIKDEKLKFADIIERALRIGRGETFDEPLGPPQRIIEFDEVDNPLEDVARSYLKGLFDRSGQASSAFAERLGVAPVGGYTPQQAAETKFGENPDPTALESVAGALGSATPFLAGGVLTPGLIPGALGGGLEELITGGSPEDVIFSTLGGGAGGLLGKIGRGLGKEGAKTISTLDLRRELTAIEKAVDTGIDHVVTRPDFDLFPEVPVSEFDRVLGDTIRKTAREGFPEVGPSFSREVPDIAQQSLPGIEDIARPNLFDDFNFTATAPKTAPGTSYTEILGEYLTKQADEAGISPDKFIGEFTATVPLPDTPGITSKLLSGELKIPEDAKGLLKLRELQSMELIGQFQRGIKATSPVKKTLLPFPKNNPILRKADAIISSYLTPILEGPFIAKSGKTVARKEARGMIASLLKQTPDVGRMKMAMEIEKGGQVIPAGRESLSAAKEIVVKSFGSGLTPKEARATVEAMDPDVILKLAKETDDSVLKAADSTTRLICETLSRRVK